MTPKPNTGDGRVVDESEEQRTGGEYLWRERDADDNPMHAIDQLRVYYEPEIEDFDSYEYSIVTWDEVVPDDE